MINEIESKNKYQKIYYQKNKMKCQEYAKQYYKNNLEYYKHYYFTKNIVDNDNDNDTMLTYYQMYYNKNRERLKKYQREYIAKKRHQLKIPTEHPKLPIIVKSSVQIKTNKIIKDLNIMKEKAEAFKASLSNPDI
jgi:hypothetical protein